MAAAVKKNTAYKIAGLLLEMNLRSEKIFLKEFICLLSIINIIYLGFF